MPRKNLCRSNVIGALQTALEIVLGISMKPNELYQFLFEAVVTHPKLRIVSENEAALGMRFLMVEDKCGFHFDVAIFSEAELCHLYFNPVRKEDSSKLADAVATVIEGISEHTQKINKSFDYRLYPLEEMDTKMEKVATYLQKNHIATPERITRVLGMTYVDVSMGIHRLMQKGIIGVNNERPRSFFLK